MSKTMTWNYKGEADITLGEVHISPLPKIVLYTTIELIITLGFIFRDSIYDLLVNPQIMLSGVVSTDNGYMLEIPYQSNFNPETYIDKVNTREYESFINPDIKSYSYNIDGVVDVNTLGKYQITYNSHNRVKSQHTILTVYVKDTDSPIITLQNPKTHESLKTNTDGTYKSLIILRGEGNNKYLGTNDFSVESFIGTITDNCSNAENINVTYPDKPVFGNKEVEYVELKYIATDEAGLSSEAVLNLIVTDDISNIDVADIDNILDDDNIQDKIVRCVGNAKQRFMEDPLKVLRAMRFAIKYGFTIEDIPCIGAPHNSRWHPHEIYEHILYVVDGCKSKFEIKLAALLHDIGKPASRVHDDEYNCDHFYGHQLTSVDIAKEVFANDLRISTRERERVLGLILHYDDHISPEYKHIRRFIVNTSEDLVRDWIFLIKEADINDHRCPAGEEDVWNDMLQRFEQFKKNIDIVVAQENAFKITDLAVGGKDIIDLLNIKPGPQVGQILKGLFEAVIDEQVENERTALLELAKTLA